MQIHIYIPHIALQEYILNISTVSFILNGSGQEVITPYPPTPFQSMIFYCNHPVSMEHIEVPGFEKQSDTVLIGPQFSRVNIKVHQQLHAIRVDFLPGGLYRLLGVPMHEMFDRGFDATDFFDAELRTVNEQLKNTPCLKLGKERVEQFLLKQAAKLRQTLPFDEAMRVLLMHNGNLSINRAASLACLSLKQFERKCKERIGMNPKSYVRILKFSKAYRLHEACPHLSWTQIAYEAGYYDQMHMIRDFKTFAGVSPSVIQQQLLSTPLRMQKDLTY